MFDGAPTLPFGWLRLWLKEAAPESTVARIRAKEHRQWIVDRQVAISEIHQLIAEQLATSEALKHEREATERAKAEAIAAEQTRLAAMSPLERELQPLLARGKSAIGELMKGLESGKWQGSDAALVAGKLKALLEQNDSWVPVFNGSNKQKKKKHERTLKVIDFLGTGNDCP